MSGQKFKHAILGTAAAGALVIGLAGQANAALSVLESWQLNLGVASGMAWTGGPAGTVALGLPSELDIDYMNLAGKSQVHQTLSGGLPFGQTFTDSGFLQIQDYFDEGSEGCLLCSSTGLGLPSGYSAKFIFSGLTGTFNTGDTITFDTVQSGKIDLILEKKITSTTFSTLTLASFDLIAPSGGTGFTFQGGANLNGHVDITMTESTGLPGLFTGGGASDGPPTLHLINVDALINPAFSPNPLYTGAGCVVTDSVIPNPNPPPATITIHTPDANCTDAFFNISNGGQYNLARDLPEPATLSLLGAGLALMGFGKRRRKSRS